MSTETARLLADVRALLVRYVVLPADHYYDAVALWTLHAHAVAAADTTPRLIFKSPEKESGKTRALEVLEVLVPAPLAVMNTTTAAIFRLLASEQATILFDEVDAVFNPKGANHEDLRALLNAGYRRGATVARVVGEGKRMRVERFPVFAATVLAAIGDLPDTIESRAVIVPMRRRAPHERVEPFRQRTVHETASQLRAELTAWSTSAIDTLLDADPQMPPGVTDRAADCWAPLLAIAELAGDEWTQRGRSAVAAIVQGRVAEDASIGVRLLADIHAVMRDRDRMSSLTLCATLNALDESPWGGWNEGKGIGSRDLARRLKVYGISSRTVRFPDGTTAKGYHDEDFADAWARYLRAERTSQNEVNVTKGNAVRVDVTPVTPVTHVGGGEEEQLNVNGHRSSVPVGSVTCVTAVTSNSEALRNVTFDDREPLPDEHEYGPDVDEPLELGEFGAPSEA